MSGYCAWLAQYVEQKLMERKAAGSIPVNDNKMLIKMDLVTTTCFLWLIVHNLPLSSNTLNVSVI